MKIIAIIPARMASTRFPGKPLADILGLPMIEHVRRRVELSKLINEVYVATCDKEIYDRVIQNGGKAIMTSALHERCCDRIAEAALSLSGDIVINVQGDEPLVDPEMFNPLLEPLINDPDLGCSNLMSEITTDEDFNSPNIVKVVCDRHGNAIYFSREPIPSIKKAGDIKYKKFKQLGIMAFRKDFLQVFSKLKPTPLEAIESVDMLRAVEHGYKVRMIASEFQVLGVDTPQDLERVKALMKNDKIFIRTGS
ncbi:MAG: 3-deoxy-manno-octulosonate cytidylyltransferase [Candidatus Margulisiibacteriota bacterium]